LHRGASNSGQFIILDISYIIDRGHIFRTFFAQPEEIVSVENFTPYSALIGGVLLGISATFLLWLNGRIAGISGIFGAATRPRTPDRVWRILFLIGLISGGAIWWQLMGPTFIPRTDFSMPGLIVAGVLVGFGTRLGNGCTSGHGVCGLGRGSRRSLAATVTFFSIALLTTFVVRHVIGGGV
jgi:uncharacterized membrane protein YedE/YeeE